MKDRHQMYDPLFVKGVRWNTVSTSAELQKVGELRLTAYSDAGKMPPSSNWRTAFDEFDEASVLSFGEDETGVVATARVTLGPATEYHSIVGEMPRFSSEWHLGSISRIATAQRARGSGLVYAMTLFGLWIAREHGLTHLLGGATSRLAGVYARVGARRVGVRFRHASLSGVEEELLIFDLASALSGASIAPELRNLASLTAQTVGCAGVPLGPLMHKTT